MDPHLNDLTKLHQMWHWLLDTWQAAVVFVSIMITSIMFVLRSMFVTRKSLEAYNETNRKDHQKINDNVQTIKSDVQYIKGFIEKQNGKQNG